MYFFVFWPIAIAITARRCLHYCAYPLITYIIALYDGKNLHGTWTPEIIKALFGGTLGLFMTVRCKPQRFSEFTLNRSHVAVHSRSSTRFTLGTCIKISRHRGPSSSESIPYLINSERSPTTKGKTTVAFPNCINSNYSKIPST